MPEVAARKRIPNMPGELTCGIKNTQYARGVGLREGEYTTCPGSWPAGSKILNMPWELAYEKENTQHARGFDSREEEGKGLNMPGVLSRGKKKKEVNKISVKRLWEPTT